MEEIKIIEQPLLSVDNIHFFNPLSKKIIITEADGGEYKPLTSIPSELNVKQWGTVSENLLTPDVYVDQDINGCDEEVKGLVSALNSIPYIETTGSCSGHGKKCAFVDIKFLRMDKLVEILKLLEKYFVDEFILCSNPFLRQTSPSNVMMSLFTTEKGEKAYKSLARLAKIIEIKFL